MKTVKVVIGANFGDEGKGHMTDYFSQKYRKQSPIVIRYNSGAQAGHTVTREDGTRHVFSHFGSGTLAGVPTYLSRFFVANPLVFQREYDELVSIMEQEEMPAVGISKDCLVTTPYDMLINQAVENFRREGRHGSCGLGFYETLIRSKRPEYCLTVDDLRKETLGQMLRAIALDYVPQRLQELGVPMDERVLAVLQSKELVEDTLMAVSFFNQHVTVQEMAEAVNKKQVLIFEGAQGLMLDEGYRFFPHVTPSKTGISNVITLLGENPIGRYQMEVVYVSRWYLTRHGAGPLPGELPEKPYEGIVDLTNQPNEYQGRLRFAYLDLDLLKENIAADSKKAAGVEMQISLAITCSSQMEEEFILRYEGREHSVKKGELERILKEKVLIPAVYIT